MGDDDSDEKIRREARAKAERIERARIANEALLLDEVPYIYALLDARLLAARSASGAPTAGVLAPEQAPPSSQSDSAAESSPQAKRAKRRPVAERFVTRAEKVIADNPQGLRAYEIAAAIAQSPENIRTTLKKLRAKGRIVSHGRMNRALWTLPGVEPSPRMTSIDDAIFEVLTRGPKGSPALIEAATEVFRRATGKTVTRSSVATRITRLLRSAQIVPHGADERGAIYAIAPENDVDDEESGEGGDGDKRIIN